VRSPNGQPYDLTGNVSGIGGASITSLSGLAGGTVTYAGVPSSALIGRASLADYAALANSYNTGDLTRDRSLISKSDKGTLRGSYSRDLNKQTQLTISGNLEDTSSHALLGLPGVTFTLPAAQSVLAITDCP